MRLTLFTLLVVALPVALADETEPKDSKIKAREITVKGLPSVRGAFKEPTKITTDKELEKAISSKETREEIRKQVDLKKEFLVLFQWAGSGQDKLDMSVEKNTATFTRTPGRTRDLRNHVKLYALPLKTEVKIGK